MKPKEIKRFEQLTRVYHFGKIQDFMTFYDVVTRAGYTITDIEDYIETKKATIQAKLLEKPARPVLKECPECQKSMSLLRVNIDSATQTGDSSKSVWLCMNQDCMNTIYNTESVEEILMKAGKHKENKNSA